MNEEFNPKENRRQCYASVLSDCAGQIEREHFLPKSLQQLFGNVVVSGMAWQNGEDRRFSAGNYAFGRMICERHHDLLDGLDNNALGYFRNLLLAAGGIRTRYERGHAQDIRANIDGRSLEIWFLKVLCGAIASRSIQDPLGISLPKEYVEVLFGRAPWPESWSISVLCREHLVERDDFSFTIDFHWHADGGLNGVVIMTCGVETVFSFRPLPDPDPALLSRPDALEFHITRPDGSPPLQGMELHEPLRFSIVWS